MTERCPHERLDYLDPAQRRGWVCAACGESGPTVVKAVTNTAFIHEPAEVMVLCVCGSGRAWPFTATGDEVARYLAEHADCKPQGDGQ